MNVPVEGLYNIGSPISQSGNNSDIRDRSKSTAKSVFGARHLSFQESGRMQARSDRQGNQIRAPLAEELYGRKPCCVTTWVTTWIPISSTSDRVNRIRLISEGADGARRDQAVQAEQPPSYDELLASYAQAGYQSARDFFLKIQAADTKYKSEQTLYPVHDKGDPSLEPYHPVQIRLNSIGGYSWQRPGQWVSWEFEVPEDGLYMIALKSKQNLRRGNYSNRRLLIDGKVPFAEADAIRFRYSRSTT